MDPKEIRHNAQDDTESGHVSLHPRVAWMMCYNQTGSVQEVCRKFGISRKTFYKWFKRYKSTNGDSSSLQDQSRRPHHFPNATPEAYVTLLKRVRDETGFGQRRLRVYLQQHYNIRISERTIWKILRNSGFSEVEKAIPPSTNLSFARGTTPFGDHTPGHPDDGQSPLFRNPFGDP
jgi:transposase